MKKLFIIIALFLSPLSSLAQNPSSECTLDDQWCTCREGYFEESGMNLQLSTYFLERENLEAFNQPLCFHFNMEWVKMMNTKYINTNSGPFYYIEIHIHEQPKSFFCLSGLEKGKILCENF